MAVDMKEGVNVCMSEWMHKAVRKTHEHDHILQYTYSRSEILGTCPRRDMGPHLGIDLARLGGNGPKPRKGRVVVAVNITTRASAFVFPTKGVIHVRVASITTMTIGHDRGTLR